MKKSFYILLALAAWSTPFALASDRPLPGHPILFPMPIDLKTTHPKPNPLPNLPAVDRDFDFINNNDLDNDGVINSKDICVFTPKGNAVDAQGCSAAERGDEDGDGVINGRDFCLNTPKGKIVNFLGCHDDALVIEPDKFSTTLDFNAAIGINQALAGLDIDDLHGGWQLTQNGFDGEGKALSVLSESADSAQLSIEFETTGGHVGFDFAVFENIGSAHLDVFLNEQPIVSIYNQQNTKRTIERNIEPGEYQLKFVFVSDDATGQNKAIIDNLKLPIQVNPDSDGDGTPNDTDAFPNDPTESADADEDGVGDNRDNCPTDFNPSQTDSNNDGRGDACSAVETALDPGRSLMITNLRVTADADRTFDRCDLDGDGNLGNPDGAWTFKTLMTNLAGGEDVQEFTHRWLQTWLRNQRVNGLTISGERGRGLVALMGAWDGRSASSLNMDDLPFRLLAIVNRPDLARRNPLTNQVEGAETRFVFGITTPSCRPGAFSVIFEFGNLQTQCQSNIDHQREWLRLSSLPLGSNEFNAALDNVTADVIALGADPSSVSGSAINQVRTNEIETVLAGANSRFLWEFREFSLTRAGLTPDTIKRTPERRANSTSALAQFVLENKHDLELNLHTIPERFQGRPFLAASIQYNIGDFWRAPSIDPNDNDLALHQLSLNTCNGCHAGETDTPFVHIDPMTGAGRPARLSSFMTGATVSDPRSGTVREFNELQARTEFVESMLTMECNNDSQAIHGASTTPLLRQTSVPEALDVFDPSRARPVH